jgi:hypothetical protein
MNEVERVHEELRAVGQIVSRSNDISAILAYGEHSAKVLLLVGASYFERQIISAIEEWIHAATQSAAMRHFVLNQAVERKFFSLFNFSADSKNINGFLANFGADYSKWAKEDMKAATIDGNIQQTFLNFCRLRNSLVHSNYATYNIDKTIDEIWTEFERAEKLVRWIEGSFRKFNRMLKFPQMPSATDR